MQATGDVKSTQAGVGPYASRTRTVLYAPGVISLATEGSVRPLGPEHVAEEAALGRMVRAAQAMGWPRLYYAAGSLAVSLRDGVVYVGDWSADEGAAAAYEECEELSRVRAEDIHDSRGLFDLLRRRAVYMDRVFEITTGVGRDAVFSKVVPWRKQGGGGGGGGGGAQARPAAQVFDEANLGELIGMMRARAGSGAWLCCYDGGDIELRLRGLRPLRCVFCEAHAWRYVQSYRWRDVVRTAAGRLASNLFEYEYGEATWVDAVTHLNDDELLQRTYREIGGVYAVGTVLPRYMLGEEAERPLEEVLRDVRRGWMWQELNFGNVIVENEVGALALLLARGVKDVSRLAAVNGRVTAVDSGLVAAAIRNADAGEFSVEADRYRASLSVIAALCQVDMDASAFNKVCRLMYARCDAHLYKLRRRVDGLRNLTTYFSAASRTVTLGTGEGSRFVCYGPWGDRRLECRAEEGLADGDYWYVTTEESTRAPDRTYFRMVVKKTEESFYEHWIEVEVSREAHEDILARVRIDECAA